MIETTFYDAGWGILFLPAMLFGMAVSLFWIVLFLPALLIWLWFLARICRKAGFSGWWSLTTLFPPLLAAMIWVLAFADWPGRPHVEILPPRR